MTANVFFQIMPNQRIVVDDLKNGRTPDAKYGKIAKVRSTHNNYLTLPVIFLMLSNHYPLSFGTEYAWIIASLIFLTGVTIRHYFNTMHSTGDRPDLDMGCDRRALHHHRLALDRGRHPRATRRPRHARFRLYEQKMASADGFEDAYDTVVGNCSMCHAREPVWEGMLWPPKGVVLETRRRRRTARRRNLLAGWRQPRHAAP